MAILKVKTSGMEYYDSGFGKTTADLFYTAFQFRDPNTIDRPWVSANIFIGTLDLGSTPLLTFPTIEEGIEYYKATKCADLLTNVNTMYGSSFYTDYITVSEQLPTIWNSGTPTLNSGSIISTTRDIQVNYPVTIASSLSLSAGEQGTVYLEYADDAGFSTNLKEVCRINNGNTGLLTLGLNTTQTYTGCLSGRIPARKYIRLRTQNNNGTPTFTARPCQELLL